MMAGLSSVVARSRQSRVYRIARVVALLSAVAYVLLLSFPQPLFAHEMTFKNFTVYAREPLAGGISAVLDKVDARLATSPLYTPDLRPKIFLVNSTRLYASLSLYLGSNSYGKGFAVLPAANVFINAYDLDKDLVFRDAPAYTSRSLSGVIAHEVTHLLVRNRFGYFRNLTLPVWKKEGYAEYVAGRSTLPLDTGVRMWKAKPNDDTGYQYFKYYMLVRYLLEHEQVTVEDLFTRDFDVKALAVAVLKTL
jgi:hypothetical protein